MLAKHASMTMTCLVGLAYFHSYRLMQLSSSTSFPVDLAGSALRHAREAVWLHFFSAGFLFAAWGVNIPQVKHRYGFDEAMLGVAILVAGVGSLAALGVAGRLIPRLGATRATFLGLLVACVGLATMLIWPDRYGVFGGLVVFGFFSSLLDVAMNAEAAQMEKQSGRRLMSVCHGMFSLGGMSGATVGSGLLAGGFPVAWQLPLMAAGIAVLGVLARSRLPAGFCPPERRLQSGTRRLSWFPRSALWLGILAALAFFSEGAMYDWSVLYLRDELGSAPQQAAMAYAFFSAAMAIGRFGGDWLRARVPAAVLLAAGAALAASAVAMVLMLGDPHLAMVGFALTGLGLSNVVPVLLGAGARLPGVAPASGLAAVASLGYAGLMSGPAIIGFAAHATSLTHALFMVVGCTLLLAVGARHVLKT